MPIRYQQVTTPNGPATYLGRTTTGGHTYARVQDNRTDNEILYPRSTVSENLDFDGDLAQLGHRQYFTIDMDDPPMVTVVSLSDDWHAIVGFGWAVYGVITPTNLIHSFIGWKQRSSRSQQHLTLLEAVSAKRCVGAPSLIKKNGSYRLKLRQTTSISGLGQGIR